MLPMRSLISVDDGDETKSVRDSELASLIGQAKIAITAGVEQEFIRCEELAGLEITAAQFVILRNVLRGSAESACELCHSMDYDRGAMSRMIDRLETKGLLRRVPLAHTRRTMALEVTDAGRAAFPKMQACLSRVIDRLLTGVSQSEVRAVERTLRRILANS